MENWRSKLELDISKQPVSGGKDDAYEIDALRSEGITQNQKDWESNRSCCG